jgi:hypothetical protein
LAASSLEQGDEASACRYLGQYLATHPEHHEVRLHHAELLLRTARIGEAKVEFARYIAHAQERGDTTLRQRVQCHCRLMEIAESEDDDYAWHLHRGVGLYLLGLERAILANPKGELPAEGLFCKSAVELGLARAQRPNEARPCWYLFKVWSALGQQGPAKRWLQRARAAAFSSLTVTEQCGLELASRAVDASPSPPLKRP